MGKVIFGVSGGIAAYKAADIANELTKAGEDVWPIMTRHAMEFLAPLTLETLSHHKVDAEEFGQDESYRIRHISLTEDADLLLIAPATANVLAKAAHGIGDDLLSTTILAANCPILAAPAMNTRMWENPATQENVKILEARGWRFIGPDEGRLACGTVGRGKLDSVDAIVAAALEALHPRRDLAGKKVVVTAGPTREKLDPVRYITNFSSGKMGYALAAEALARGAETVLISGPVALTPPKGAKVVNVESTRDLYEACVEAFASADLLIMAAAPADFRPADVAEQKIKKEKGEGLSVTFVENPDIAAALGRMKKPGQLLVTFAAETEKMLEHARAKLAAKGADLMVANDVSRKDAGFNVDTNAVTLLRPDDSAPEVLPLLSKRETAARILDAAEKLWGEA